MTAPAPPPCKNCKGKGTTEKLLARGICKGDGDTVRVDVECVVCLGTGLEVRHG